MVLQLFKVLSYRNKFRETNFIVDRVNHKTFVIMFEFR